MFKDFNAVLQANFEGWTGELFVTDVDPDLMWETYLNSFPAGTNELYRERTEHDCSCCRHFIKRFGNVVTIVDGELVSIWDIEAPRPYDKVCQAMSSLVKTEIKDVFLHNEKQMGTAVSMEQTEDGVLTWDHFHCETPARAYSTRLATDRGDIRTNKNVFKRSMDELTVGAGETILELIAQGTLYRGDEFKTVIREFVKLRKEYEKLSDEVRDNWCWTKCKAGITRVRNTAIGTLLVDISNGEDLDTAVRKFESIMAPSNYKRPKAIITKKMVKDAEKKINELGFANSLGRRFASLEDITVNNVLFVNRSTKKKIGGSPFDDLETVEKPRSFKRVQEVSIKDFVNDVLPTAQKIRVMLEGKHKSNLVSLVAPEDREAPTMFKWGNNFSWAYNGDLADSMKERVKNAGGKVDGVLRFSIQWNDTGETNSDYDAHCQEPGGHIYYGNKRLISTQGNLDVDIINPAGRVAVENITWPTLSKMKNGKYKFSVHNYTKGNGHGGFSAEIEFDGEIHSFHYPHDLRNNETVQVATVTKTKDGFTIESKLNSTVQREDVWGVKTGEFVEVDSMMFSPNYWDEQQVGNQHYFFILNGCKNDGEPRGFFNEFLKEELTPHKRVFEALGSRMRVEQTPNQLSGVGFSSTQRNSVVVEVEGKTKRVMKLNF